MYYIRIYSSFSVSGLTIKDRDGSLQESRTSHQFEVIDITDQEMVTDAAETVETRWHSHQQLHQPHKLKGYVGREWRQTLQGTLLQGEKIQYCLSLQISIVHTSSGLFGYSFLLYVGIMCNYARTGIRCLLS